MACSQCAARQADACNLQIDYSTVQGARILPFVIALDLEDSVLQPAPDQRQRFCYRVIAVGEDDSQFADLSHLVLGICNRIQLSDLRSVTVMIDGEPQRVELGENVEIRTEERPDPPTQCPGLKFDFPLDKVSGDMRLCFELNSVYGVGSIPVCLYGGGVTANSLMICGPVCGGENQCAATGYQTVNVCLPVTVTPYARVGDVRTYCCGTPVVTPGMSVCPGERMGSCTFTLRQRVCIAVPVDFGADVQPGEHSVDCQGASDAPPQFPDDPPIPANEFFPRGKYF